MPTVIIIIVCVLISLIYVFNTRRYPKIGKPSQQRTYAQKNPLHYGIHIPLHTSGKKLITVKKSIKHLHGNKNKT